MKDVLANLDAARRNANDVEAAYLASNTDSVGISLEQAFDEIAEAQGIAPETVKKHHRKHKDEICKGLEGKGILKGS